MSRTYFKSGINELEALFESPKLNKALLKSLLQELKHREKPRAVALRRKVEECLSQQVAEPLDKKEQFIQKAIEGSRASDKAVPQRTTQETHPSKPLTSSDSSRGDAPTPVPPERISVECAHCNTPNFVSTIEGVVQNLSCSGCHTPYIAQFKYGVLRTKFLAVEKPQKNYPLAGLIAMVVGAIALLLLLLK